MKQSLITTSKRVFIQVAGAGAIEEKDILLLMNNTINVNFRLVNITKSEYNDTIDIIECELLSQLEVGTILFAKVARAGYFSEAQPISDYIQNGMCFFFILIFFKNSFNINTFPSLI